jgi:hypothetical protein
LIQILQIGGKHLVIGGVLVIGGYFAYKHFKKPAVPALPGVLPTGALLPGQLPGTVAGSPYPGQAPVNPALYGGVYPTSGVAPLGYSQATSPAYNPYAQNLVQPNYGYPQVGQPATNITSQLPVGVAGGAQPGMLMGFAGYRR